jgi:glutathione S-transferase
MEAYYKSTTRAIKGAWSPLRALTAVYDRPSNRELHTMAPIDEGDPDYPKLEPPYLKLYSLGTPNGQKVTLYLELLKLKYHYRHIDISKDTQKEPWFLKLNPNGRIPTLSDVDAQGKRTTLFETGAILQYLGEKYDTERKYYHDLSSPYYWDQVTWLTFQVASHAPYQGQANHFIKFAPEDVPYGKKRYKNETERVFGVFELRLKANNGWLVGEGLNIADIAAYPWIKKYDFIGIDIAQFPELKKWLDKIDAIPGVQEGLDVK